MFSQRRWHSRILGDRLAHPESPNANWQGPAAVPGTGALNTEVGVVYVIDAGATGLQSMTVSLGVGNGAFVRFDGVYQFGALAPDHAVLDEYIANLLDVAPGKGHMRVVTHSFEWDLPVDATEFEPVTPPTTFPAAP